MYLLSDAEREYIQDGAEQGVRGDGRAALDVRPVTLETGVLPNAAGSARVRIGQVTDILVGVKGEITEPSTEKPDEGQLSFSVECSSLASPDFVGRGGMDLNAELSQYLTYLYENSSGLREFKKSLSLINGKKCWLLHIDALILDSGGNLFGALSLAVRAALRVVVLPDVIIIPGEADNDDDIQVDEQSFHLIDHSFDAPVAVTLSIFNNVKSNIYLADCTSEEESCAKFTVTVGVNTKGKICGVVSAGNLGVDIDSLNNMLKDAVAIGVDMLKTTDSFLEKDLENRLTKDSHDDVVGFFA